VRSCDRPGAETTAAAGTVSAVPADAAGRRPQAAETKALTPSADGVPAAQVPKAADKPAAARPEAEAAQVARTPATAPVHREGPDPNAGKKPDAAAAKKPPVAEEARRTADRTAESRAEGAREGAGRAKSFPIIDTGKISITIRDVYVLVNETAEKNNYRRLDSPKDGRPDPNLIYPGTVFVLPDGTSYTVVKGDTLWGITARFIRKSMREQEDAYKKLMISDRPKDEVIAELGKLRDSSRSMNLKARFTEALKQIEEE